ncbi:THO complex subunit 5 homolog [Centruroides sculpturatus]|uniref:THO complex subunit 5 homolog n=1 Tax=Centruroides sculpturatus TaxID=218467 RepID=UPI000C6E2474|nr:THO complex subunit 5 homolog [Centruroides sculpturatus]
MATAREKKVKRIKSQEVSQTAAVTSNIADCFLLEEDESQKRDADKDYVLFKKTCDEIREHMKEILRLKEEKKSDTDEFEEHRVNTCMLFLVLKKLNRLDKHRCKRVRESVSEVKQKVDNFHLQLQNLQYEVMHLQKEVTKCLEFRSKDEEIELVPVEEFYKEAPAKISRPTETKNDPHQLTLARLEWELEQRKRLSEKLHKTESQKQEYLQEIEKKKECLENLQPTLKSIACDQNLHINIEGNVEEAKTFQTQAEQDDEDSGDSDQEEASTVKRHRRSTIDREEITKNVLSKHPLTVSITVKCNKETSMCVNFSYLLHLHIVTALVKSITPHLSSGVSAGDLLKPDLLLNCLFPNDFGKESPNPANHYQLKKISSDQFESFLTQNGRPYHWAQRIAGLEFLPVTNENLPSWEDTKVNYQISASSMEMTLRSMHSRLQARIALHAQLSSLERGTIPVPSDVTDLFPSKVSIIFKNWTCSTWDEFLTHPSSADIIELGLATEDHSVFKATVERGLAKLSTFVLIPPDYPSTSSLFLLTVNWKSERTGRNDPAVLELEQEVNVYCVEMLPASARNYILSCQLQHLLVSFDIYLETESARDTIEGPREFSQGKVLTRSARGRSRSKPYKYLPNYGLFTHR